MGIWILGMAVAVALVIVLVVFLVWLIRTAKRHDREDEARDLDRYSRGD